MSAKIVPERAGLAPAHTRDVHYEYDLRGLQTRARFDGAAGEGVTNVYDGFGRLVSSSSDMGGTARSVGNLYDANGNRVRVVHPDGSYFTYDMDGLDRPTAIRENGGAPIASFTYDNAGRRATSGWAAVTAYAYDPAGRLQTLSHNLIGDSRDQILGFTYNPASQIQTRSASNDAYAWRPSENVARAYAANGLNQYVSAGPATFGYDPNGNLASTVHPGVASTAYLYDIENRLVSASGSHNAELLYDPLGRLFQVSSPSGGIRRLVYDGDALVAEYDTAGNMPHRYIHGNDAGDDPLVWYDNFASGWRRALMTDHQGSVIQIADMYGNPVATNSYDPWGIPAATNAGRFGYTGQTWVPELGLWYYKARFYSPTTGRFLQVDPVGYDDQINLYAYVGNDPVNGTDASGMCPVCVAPWVPEIVTAVGVGLVAIGVLSEGKPDRPAPPLPTDPVGTPPHTEGKGGQIQSGPLHPNHGGTGNPHRDHDHLTGGTGKPNNTGGRPPGTRVGDNGIQIRPGKPGQGPRIDIPPNGPKPGETLHYPPPVPPPAPPVASMPPPPSLPPSPPRPPY